MKFAGVALADSRLFQVEIIVVQRKIIHVDMDAFYASVEQRDNPSLRGKPVVVGGPPNSRSVVCAASYEARKFGVRSAIPCSQAERLCPHAIFVPPRFPAYREVSQQIMEIFRRYTEAVEPLSLDEAYLDVTENFFKIPSATWIATEIREKIRRTTGLTASAGVAPNKFLAKIASDMNKPDGLTVITPSDVETLLQHLPMRKVPGVGKVTEEKLRKVGILTTNDLRNYSEERLNELFGAMGSYYFRIARGIDDREVHPTRERKSVGAEETFPKDILDVQALRNELVELGKKVWRRRGEHQGRTVTVKVTYSKFEKATRARTLPRAVESEEELIHLAFELLGHTEAGTRPIRLVGVTLSHFEGDDEKNDEEQSERLPVQLELSFGSSLDDASMGSAPPVIRTPRSNN